MGTSKGTEDDDIQTKMLIFFLYISFKLESLRHEPLSEPRDMLHGIY